MPGKFFLDTNILVYAFQQADVEKQKIAANLLKEAIKTQKGIISYQVIQEFLNVALQKFKIPFQADDCKNLIDKYLSPICEIFSSAELFKEAVDIKSDAQIGFYDSLIVAAAELGNADTLYTEDLSDGQKIRGVAITNPFPQS
jgi:predicted nucleic acid-binding protein